MLHDIQLLNSPNFEDRQGYKPIIFVLHITDGQEAVRASDVAEENAVDFTFMSKESQCSSHDGIERDGRIKNYVDIKYTAWTQGLHGHDDCQKSLSPIVRSMDTNPNYYSLGIEYLAYKDHGGDGTITDAQFWAGCWLIKYRQDQVQQMYGHKIPLNSSYVIGHYQVDPVFRPFDPGVNFPWARLCAELAIADNMTLQDYEGRLVYLGSDAAKASQAFAIGNEITYLWNMSKGTDGNAQWAKNVLLGLHPVMTSLGLLTKPYSADTSQDDVANQALYLYQTGQVKDGNGTWAKEQLLKMFPYMLQNGLV